MEEEEVKQLDQNADRTPPQSILKYPISQSALFINYTIHTTISIYCIYFLFLSYVFHCYSPLSERNDVFLSKGHISSP
jgi:hypothetical protein